jgi:hypothetical protein
MILAPTSERWRVADTDRNAVAHLITVASGAFRATACNWLPSTSGVLLSREQMVSQCRWACVKCVHVAKGRPGWRAL